MSRRRWEDEVELADTRGGVEPLWGGWSMTGPAPDLSDCVAARLPGSRHLLALWEPIDTHAPSPARCQPYCCYIRSVIFYARPYISRPGKPWRGRDGVLRPASGAIFVEYDQVETRLGELREMILAASPELDATMLVDKLALGFAAATAAGMSDASEESA